MSGSGSSTGGGGVSTDDYDCLRYIERVHLSSPSPEVVLLLSIGETLEVRLAQRSNVTIIEAATSRGEIAGSLIPGSMARLINCLSQGIHYIAVILSIDNGSVRVEIRPRPE